jgi:uncharacterized protein YbjQ (UPF0145 family)
LDPEEGEREAVETPLFGGNITLYTELCEKTRAEAFDLMFEHACGIGANAVVGIKYDANEVADGVTEVLCYGTAVVVEANGDATAKRGGADR